MSVLIIGMEMPLPGQGIEVAEGIKGAVYARLTPDTDDEWHKVIKVPPHGRLIDADALEDENITYYAVPIGHIRDADPRLVIPLADLDNAPTIIEAERT